MTTRRREDGLPVTASGRPAYRVIMQEWAAQRETIRKLQTDVAHLARNEREDQRDISALTIENGRLRQQLQALYDQHGTFPPMGYKSELKGL